MKFQFQMKQACTFLKERTCLPTVRGGTNRTYGSPCSPERTNRTYGLPARPVRQNGGRFGRRGTADDPPSSPVTQNGVLAPFWRQGGQWSMAAPVVDQSSTGAASSPVRVHSTYIGTYVRTSVRTQRSSGHRSARPAVRNASLERCIQAGN